MIYKLRLPLHLQSLRQPQHEQYTRTRVLELRTIKQYPFNGTVIVKKSRSYCPRRTVYNTNLGILVARLPYFTTNSSHLLDSGTSNVNLFPAPQIVLRFSAVHHRSVASEPAAPVSRDSERYATSLENCCRLNPP